MAAVIVIVIGICLIQYMKCMDLVDAMILRPINILYDVLTLD